jgi:TolA-binding protein
MIEMYRTASLYKKMGDNENAITRFEKLLDLDRKMTLTGGVYFHLGELYLTEGDQSRARKMFQYCCSHIPDHQKAAHYLEQLK